ncbi:MAG: shikimate dehydrogenase [Bacteroidia bacterium]|nr:shikimate dehydrogenase [Bacteroidia bacterium]HQV01114.1 shikimate dehydrogenase [Bacteroidia bacterium]
MPAKLFGLIGRQLSHSYSAQYFNQKFAAQNLDALYKLFEIAEINQLTDLISRYHNLVGLNVTIPYKQEIIHLLDRVTPQALAVNAVNTIKIIDGKCCGYNTDVIGFEQTLQNIHIANKTALIFGFGGAAQAIAYVLKQHQFQFLFVVRCKTNPHQILFSELDNSIIKQHTLLINCTPVGMYPITNLLPLPYAALTPTHVCYDLVYNPTITPFLAEAQKHGAIIKNGLEMLHLQAEASWKIWQT